MLRAPADIVKTQTAEYIIEEWDAVPDNLPGSDPNKKGAWQRLSHVNWN